MYMHKHIKLQNTQAYNKQKVIKAHVFTVLASEEYKAPYVAIVKSGEATVMKQITVAMYVPGGNKVCISFVSFNPYPTGTESD